jgi:glutamyl-tRNA reductase
VDEMTLLTWRTPASDAATLEQATLPHADLERQLRDIRESLGVAGLFHMATCQRVLWVLQRAPPDAAEKLHAVYTALGRSGLPLPERHDEFEAFRHLCEVASSLDSMVPGEPQVLGQVKQAVRDCDEAQLLGPSLRHVLDLVLQTAKTVRSQTRLFEGKVSLVPLAMQAMEHAIESDGSVGVVGTGEIGAKAIEMLRGIRPGVELHVVSRDAARANASAQAHDAKGHSLDAFLANPPSMRLLVLAMDVEAPIVSAAWLATLAKPGPVTVLDLALPRNAEAPTQQVPGLRLIQLDDLTRLSEQAKQRRDAAYEDAMRVLADELDKVRQEYDLRCHASALHKLTQRFLEVSEARWVEAAVVDKQDPKARKWYEQTVRALLHEATAVVKEAPRGDRRT